MQNKNHFWTPENNKVRKVLDYDIESYFLNLIIFVMKLFRSLFSFKFGDQPLSIDGSKK